MERTPVKSSQIKAIGYDPAAQILEIEFPGRGEAPSSVYRYHDVEPITHSKLMAAESIGSHFGKNIRGKFKYAKLEDEAKPLNR